MKKKYIVIGSAVIGLALVALVEEYEPETPITTSSVQTTETTTGYRVVVDIGIPTKSNDVTVASVVTIRSYRLATVKTYENGLPTKTRMNVELEPKNSFPWYMLNPARTNASGVMPIQIKNGSADVVWRGWKNGEPLP